MRPVGGPSARAARIGLCQIPPIPSMFAELVTLKAPDRSWLMSSDRYPFPVAVSQLGEGDSRDQQALRGVEWLVSQVEAPTVIVTPQKDIDDNQVLTRFVAGRAVQHLTWRGLFGGQLRGQRVLHAWPDRDQLNQLWGVPLAALVVLEWAPEQTAEWIEDANPVRLLPDRTIAPSTASAPPVDGLPEDVLHILQFLAHRAAGYDSGLKWNEENKLKADLMNRPERWMGLSLDDIRRKCREFGLSPADVDTITGLIRRRQEGRRFNVRHGYRDFHFNG